MKRIALVIAMALLLVLPLVSAGEWDNVKEVKWDKLNLGYPEITIKNSF